MATPAHREPKWAPADEAEAVTPSDDTVFSTPTRGLYVGADGNVAVRMWKGQNSVTFVGVKGGTVLPIIVDKVLSAGSGTTASSIVRIW